MEKQTCKRLKISFQCFSAPRRSACADVIQLCQSAVVWTYIKKERAPGLPAVSHRTELTYVSRTFNLLQKPYEPKIFIPLFMVNDCINQHVHLKIVLRRDIKSIVPLLLLSKRKVKGQERISIGGGGGYNGLLLEFCGMMGYIITIYNLFLLKQMGVKLHSQIPTSFKLLRSKRRCEYQRQVGPGCCVKNCAFSRTRTWCSSFYELLFKLLLTLNADFIRKRIFPSFETAFTD